MTKIKTFSFLVKEVDRDIFFGETPPTKKGEQSKKFKSSKLKDEARDNDSDWEDLDGMAN